MTAFPGFIGLPVNATIRQIVEVVNGILRGRLNTGGSVTLSAGDSTTVNDARVSGNSKIVLEATSIEAGTLRRTTDIYISAKAKGSFTIAHVGAAGTETFDYILTAA